MFNKNYGWPITSYGKPYDEGIEDPFSKNHRAKGYNEPIYSFIPSIGISEISKVPEEFLSQNSLDNLFFISSLNGKSLYLTQFNQEYSKVNFVEKILVGERIRDILYIEALNIFVLSYDFESKIAILGNNNQQFN